MPLTTHNERSESPLVIPAMEVGGAGRILEGLATTLNADGSVNISPMGPIVFEGVDWMYLRPFTTSTTFKNLDREPQGVFHVTDDVLLLAQAAVGEPDPLPPMRAAEKVEGLILADACRWAAFEIEWIDATEDRATILARIVDRGVQREFFGFNRAKHAVVEAAILATRVGIVDAAEIKAEFARLATPVLKTGAAVERQAFEFLKQHVDERLAEIASRA